MNMHRRGVLRYWQNWPVLAGHLMLTAKQLPIPIAPSGSRVFYTTDGGLNFWGYSNPKVDELFQRVTSREALDKEVRKKMYVEISQLIAEDQSADFLSFPRGNHCFQVNVEGIDVGMRLGWNYHKWYFAEP